MGGGDLNMKKSWHPLLIKNQERVWLEEKKALEEKKKLDQLRKEKDEERQLMELQRLQERQTGRTRQEKLEWMYATPAAGSGPSAGELEDYLLGKRRVDQLLTGGENEKIGAAHKNFIATQHANTVRDTAAKVREDPLFAIKQQEQAAYQQLLKNPLKLRELQARAGGAAPDDKAARKERRQREKEERRAERHSRRERSDEPRERGYDRDGDREYDRRASRRSASPPHRGRHDDDGGRPYRDSGRARDYDRDADRARDYDRDARRSADHGARRPPPHSDESDERSDSRERRPFRATGSGTRRSPSPRARSPPRATRARSPPRAAPRAPSPPRAAPAADAERAARLAAMQGDADSMGAERRARLAERLAEETAAAAADEAARARSRGDARFLGSTAKQVFSGAGGLGERIRRGRVGLVAEAD